MLASQEDLPQRMLRYLYEKPNHNVYVALILTHYHTSIQCYPFSPDGGQCPMYITRTTTIRWHNVQTMWVQPCEFFYALNSRRKILANLANKKSPKMKEKRYRTQSRQASLTLDVHDKSSQTEDSCTIYMYLYTTHTEKERELLFLMDCCRWSSCNESSSLTVEYSRIDKTKTWTVSMLK